MEALDDANVTPDIARFALQRVLLGLRLGSGCEGKPGPQHQRDNGDTPHAHTPWIESSYSGSARNNVGLG